MAFLENKFNIFLAFLLSLFLIVLFYFSFNSSGAFADRSFFIGEAVPEGIIAVHEFSVPYSNLEKQEMILQIEQSLPIYLTSDQEIINSVSESIKEIIFQQTGSFGMAEYFASKITGLYSIGIVDLDKLRESYTGTRTIIDLNPSENISELFTLSEACDGLRLDLQRRNYPADSISRVLQLIQPNLSIDSIVRERMLQEKLQELPDIKISFQTGDVILEPNGLYTEEVRSYCNAMAISSSRAQGTINHNIGKTGLVAFLLILGVLYIWKEQKIGTVSSSLMFLFFIIWSISIILTAFLSRLKIPELSIFTFTLFGSTLTSIFFDKKDRNKNANVTWFISALFASIFSLISPYPMATFFLAFVPSCFTATLIRNLSDNDISKTILVGILSSIFVYWMLVLTGSVGVFGFNLIIWLSLIGIPLITIGTVRVLIHPFETLFRLDTALTYKRLDYENNILRKRLREEAPGTERHSKLVSDLSQKLAVAIGADETLAKLGGYFHDIGKLYSPSIFIENMIDPDTTSPHLNLSPQESAKLILDHVHEGIKLGEKEKLPKDIIAIIEQHHGDTSVKYFLEKAKKELPPGVDLNEAAFHYDGPKPQSIEPALVMISDSVSAAVTGLGVNPTNSEISSIITRVINEKKEEGEFIYSGLTEIMLRKIAHELFKEFTMQINRLPDYPHAK